MRESLGPALRRAAAVVAYLGYVLIVAHPVVAATTIDYEFGMSSGGSTIAINQCGTVELNNIGFHDLVLMKGKKRYRSCNFDAGEVLFPSAYGGTFELSGEDTLKPGTRLLGCSLPAHCENGKMKFRLRVKPTLKVSKGKLCGGQLTKIRGKVRGAKSWKKCRLLCKKKLCTGFQFDNNPGQGSPKCILYKSTQPDIGEAKVGARCGAARRDCSSNLSF